jgi:hypothetical protein
MFLLLFPFLCLAGWGQDRYGKFHTFLLFFTAFLTVQNNYVKLFQNVFTRKARSTKVATAKAQEKILEEDQYVSNLWLPQLLER